MSENWKPGEVLWCRGEIGLVTRSGGRDAALYVEFASGKCLLIGDLDASVRRLVVIDFESAEQVERLVSLARNNTNIGIESWQAALREFANPTPPKPAWTDGDVVVTDHRAYYRKGGEWQGTRATGNYPDTAIDGVVERGATILRRQSDEVTP